MKLIKTLMTAAAVTMLAGGAWAGNGNSETTGNPGKGNQGCTLLADGTKHKNPGKLMQHLRDNPTIGGFTAGGNVNDWLDNFPNYPGSAGDWINERCGEQS